MLWFTVGIGLGLAILIYFSYDNIRLKRELHRLTKRTEQDKKTADELAVCLGEQVNALKKQLAIGLNDPITQVLTKSAFEEHLHHAIHESVRYKLTLGLIALDLNDFHLVQAVLNDTTMNMLLQEMSNRLRSCLRQVDLIARFDKANFVILLSQLSKPETAAIVATRILNTFAEPFHVGGEELLLTASLGIALCPEDSQDASSLLKHAEQALFNAQQHGQSNYQFYQKIMQEESQREIILNHSLNQDMVLNTFVLRDEAIYQGDNQINVIGMALEVSWPHPQYGSISMEEIFLVAEKQSKTSIILEWLMTKAQQQFQQWQKKYSQLQFVALTLPLKLFTDNRLTYRLSQWLAQTKFSPQQLLIQVKGNFSQYSADVVEKIFNRLNYLGVRIAIDNFGSADFPLRYLITLPIDYLKLNIHWVSDVVEDKEKMKLLAALIALAQAMNKQVIAEKVENAAERQQLMAWGCILIQGELLEKKSETTKAVHETSEI